jgi:hypothetical protein
VRVAPEVPRSARQGSDRPAGLSDPPIRNKLTHINMNIEPRNRPTTRVLR